MRTGHIKVKKGIHHLFCMAIPRHTIESVCGIGKPLQCYESR